ncbi:hypothetical protein SDC9_73599 [bioreactor metagenome]|uniref:Uncharacterized protein n=1 Tax=bioreactor metagenome TaxID=1076179 RepID=A0A644YLW1_9ZZZZ
MGWHLVLSHCGAIIIGNFSTKSRIISKEALPDPTIIPALKVVNATLELASIVSTFLRDCKCFDKCASFTIPLR